MTPVFNATVQKGQMFVSNPQKFKDYLHTLDGPVHLIVRKPRKNRSENQNAWYWAAVVRIPAQHFGYTDQEMHEAFKWMFLCREERGKPPTIRSTSTLTTKEFSEFVERCRQWCAENELEVPEPFDYYAPNTETSTP